MFLAQPFSSAGFSAIAPRFGATFLSSPSFSAISSVNVSYNRLRLNDLEFTAGSFFFTLGGYLKSAIGTINSIATADALANVVYRPTLTINGSVTVDANGYLIGQEWTEKTFNAYTWSDKSETTTIWNKKG